MDFKNGLHIEDPELLWQLPELVKPDRDCDFIMKNSSLYCGQNVRKFWINERIMEFSDKDCESELSRILIDDRYGIFIDISNTQNSKSWDQCSKDTRSSYLLWLIEKNFLDSDEAE